MFMISSADFTRPLPGTEYGLAPLSQAGKGPPPGNRQGTVKSCRADLVTAAGQFPWPPAGSYLAVCGQFLAAVVSQGRDATPGPRGPAFPARSWRWSSWSDHWRSGPVLGGVP